MSNKTVIRLAYDFKYKSLTKTKLNLRLKRFGFSLQEEVINYPVRGEEHQFIIVPDLERDTLTMYEEIKLMVWLMEGYRVFLHKITIE